MEKGKKNAKGGKRNWNRRHAQSPIEAPAFYPLPNRPDIQSVWGSRVCQDPAQRGAACVAALALSQHQPVGDWNPSHVDMVIDAGVQAHREAVRGLRAAGQRFDETALRPIDLRRDFFVGVHRYEVCTRLVLEGICAAESATPDRPSLPEGLRRLLGANPDSPCAVLQLDPRPEPRKFVAVWLDRDHYYLLNPNGAFGQHQQLRQPLGVYRFSQFQTMFDFLKSTVGFRNQMPYTLYHVKLLRAIGFAPPPVPLYDEARASSPPPNKKSDKTRSRQAGPPPATAAQGPAVLVLPVPPQQAQLALMNMLRRANEPPQPLQPFQPPVATQRSQPGSTVQEWFAAARAQQQQAAAAGTATVAAAQPSQPPAATQRYDEARALSPPRSQPGATVQEWFAAARAQQREATAAATAAATVTATVAATVAADEPHRLPVQVQQRLPYNPRTACVYANVPSRFRVARIVEPLDQFRFRATPTSTMILQYKYAPDKRHHMSAHTVVALAVMQVRPPPAWQDADIEYAIKVGSRLYDRMEDENPDFVGSSALAFQDARLEIENEKLIVSVDTLTVTGPILSHDPRIPSLQQALRWFFNEKRGSASCELRVGVTLSLGIYKDEQKCFWLYDERPHDRDGKLLPGMYSGAATLYRLLSLDDLVERIVDSVKWGEGCSYELRRVGFLPDLPGTIGWFHFQPYRRSASWILRGSPGVHAAADRFDAANHDKQSLGTATLVLVMAFSLHLRQWKASTIDEILVEGDAYYTWCTTRDNEGPSEPERKLRPSNMRLVVFLRKYKFRLRVREQAVTGKLCPGEQLLHSLRFFFFELGEEFCIFEALDGPEPIRYLGLWARRDELENGIIDWTWYLFHDHATSQLARAALGDQYRDETSAIAPDQESACVLRFARIEDLRDVLVALFCRDNGDDDDDDRYLAGSLPQQQQPEQAPGQEVAFSMHALVVDSRGKEPLDDDEIAREMRRSVIPEATEYTTDTPTSGHLLGSQHGTVARYAHRQSGWTRAGSALAALAMRHLCDPFQWTTLTVDTLLDLGDAISAKWRSEIQSDDDDAAAAAAADNDPDAGEQPPPPLPQPRDYLLPHEIGSIQLGTNDMNLVVQPILDDEERQATIRQQLCRHLEELFELTYQAVLRSGRVQLAVWRFDGVYFVLEPSGNEANQYLAGVYYWLELEGLCAFLAPILLDGGGGAEIQTYGVGVESIGNVPESARPQPTNEVVKHDWYNWTFVRAQNWQLEYDEETAAEELDSNMDTSLCAVFIMMAQIHEMHQWTVGLLRQAVIVARGLHMLNIERHGEDRRFSPYDMISEFFIGNRQIRLIMEDCVAYGRPAVTNFQEGVDKMTSRYDGVILNATAPGCEHYWAIWRRREDYYCLTPYKGVVRKKRLNWSFFEDSDAAQWEMTGVYVTNSENRNIDFVGNLVDPSPAIAPSVLPPMNAYRPITDDNGYELPARGILQASVSQENVHELLKVAPHERYQSTATCVMAVGATLLHDPSTWTKGILDTILIWGYQLHQQVTSGGDSESFDIDGSTIHFVLKQFASVKPGTTKWFQINEEEARKKAEAIKKAEAMKTEEQKQKEREEKENQYVEEEEEEGYTLRPDQNKISDLREILMKCLKRFFKGSINSMILRIDRFTVAIWRSGSAYFIFDPMPRDDRGLILPPFEDGTACVIWYCALEPLVALIIGNFPGTTWSSIDIHQIRVWIPQAREDVVPQPLIEIVDRTMRTHLDALVRRGELFVPQVRAKNPYHRPLLEPVVELMDPYWRLIPNWRITVMIDDVEIIKLINPRVLQASSLHLASEALPQTVRNKQSSAVALVALALARMQSPLTWSGRTLDYIIHNGSALHAEHQLEEGRLVEQQLDVAQLPRSLQLGANLRLQARRLQYSQGCSWKGGNTALARCLEQHFDGLPSSDYGILELESDIGHRFAMAIIHSEDRYYAFDPTPSNRLMTKEKEKAAMFQCRSARELAKTIYAVFSNNIAKEALGVLAFQSYMVYAFDISPRFD